MSRLVLTLFLVVFFSPSKAVFDPQTASINSILNAIISKEATCTEIIKAFLMRIEKYNKSGPKLNAIVQINPNALQIAQQLDLDFQSTQKPQGTMHCVPLIVKDNIDVAGVPTTNGLNAFAYQIPAIDADVVANLRKHGAIPLAKANMSPFADKEAWGNSQIAGLIRNPFALDRTTYGSSGGNAAAGAAMFGVVGLGTETGVSVNLPSSGANLVGFRGPVEDLSQEGVMPNSADQDVVGPMAKRVEDVITTYDAMKKNQSATFLTSEILNPNGLYGLKINIFKFMAYDEGEIPGKGFYKVDPEIVELFSNMTKKLEKAGSKVQNQSMSIQQAMMAVMPFFELETGACIAKLRDGYFGNNNRFGVRAPFHSVQQVVNSRLLPLIYQNKWEKTIEMSKNPSDCESEKKKYQEARENLISSLLTPLLQNADVAIWPAMPEFPPKFHVDAYTRDWGSKINPPVNLILLGSWAAYPSINIPLGFSKPTPDAPQGLPIGIFAISAPENTDKLFRLAYAYQEKFGVTKLPNSVNDTLVEAEGIGVSGFNSRNNPRYTQNIQFPLNV